MNLSKIFLKKHLLFLLLVVITFVPRIIYIDRIPTSINHDESHYALDAKSLYLTGKDISGRSSLIDLAMFELPQNVFRQAELPYFLQAIAMGPFKFSLTNIALPNILLGVLTVIGLYLITYRVFNKNTAFITGFIAAINPWLIFSSRSAYEVVPAVLFFLAFFYMLLIAKSWKILLAFPIGLLAFYSYIGTKLIFLPFVFLSISYSYLYVNKRKYLKQYSLLFLLSFILVIFFYFKISQEGSSRLSEIITPNNPVIARQVNEIRHATINYPFITLFENKLTVYITILVKNTANVLSPSYLFSNADFFFLIGGHGLFYYIDAFFVVIGAVWLFLSRKKLFLFFSLFIFISILPQILHNPDGTGNFTPHNALLIPYLVILIGLGIAKFWEEIRNKKYGSIFAILVILIYLFSFLNFANFYFFRFPIQQGTFEIQNRILSKYITLSEKGRQVVVYSSNPGADFRDFLFYSNIYNKRTAGEINKSLKEDRLSYKNISFNSCDKAPKLASQPKLVIEDTRCVWRLSMKSVNIVQLKDSGARYVIYNDQTCTKFMLPHYISGLSLSDLNIEGLNQKKFCETFIVTF